jgi:hypothetical protein
MKRSILDQMLISQFAPSVSNNPVVVTDTVGSTAVSLLARGKYKLTPRVNMYLAFGDDETVADDDAALHSAGTPRYICHDSDVYVSALLPSGESDSVLDIETLDLGWIE